MSAFPRQAQGTRRHDEKRTEMLKIRLTKEEAEVLHGTARYTDDFTAAWARDVLLSRAAGLRRQRNLIDKVVAA